MAEPPEFARYGEKCPRTGDDHLIGIGSGRCMHCNGKALGWTWETVQARMNAAPRQHPLVLTDQGWTRMPPLPIDEAGEVSIDVWNRLKAQPPVVTDQFVVVNNMRQEFTFSTPSAPNTWTFTDPPPQGYEVLKGWTAVDPSIAPSRAKLTCDRNGLEPNRNDVKPVGLRPGEHVYLTPRPGNAADARALIFSRGIAVYEEILDDIITKAELSALGWSEEFATQNWVRPPADNRRIAKLTERVAIIEADNAVLEARKDEMAAQILELDARLVRYIERFRYWRGRALKLAMQLAGLKQRTQSPHPVPAKSSLDEPAAPTQDAIWRNATRFSR